MLAQYLIRQAFSRVSKIGSESSSELQKALDSSRRYPSEIPLDTHVFQLNDNFFFPNAQRIKTQILDQIQTFHAPAYSNAHGDEADRNWSVVGEQRIKKLRKNAGVRDVQNLPPINVVVLDFTKVNHFDATASLKLREFFGEIKKYAGKQAEIRLVGLVKHVRARFERARPGWELVDMNTPLVDGNVENERKEIAVRVFPSVEDAISARNSMPSEKLVEKSSSEHLESV